jgi:neopullulanase
MKKHIFFFCVYLLSYNVVVLGQDIRVEPPFWWDEMKQSTLEVMIYSPDIASARHFFDERLTIDKIDTVSNPNYLFVTINTEILEPGNYSMGFQFADGRKVGYNYVFLSREKDETAHQGFSTSDVIYLIMPDRFSNGDPTNDSNPGLNERADRKSPGGRHGGDIKGIINQLDYLHDLGVTALWCTPLCEDNDSTYSYHGYAQSDVYRIDPRYGTNEDYKLLADQLHNRGMKLIMDYVTNHWGLQHWIIQDLPEYNWINQHPGYAQSNYRMTTQFDPYASTIDKAGCMDGWFVPSMPDLNQRNPRVLRYLIQNAIWWIEYAGLDGLRVDTYSYNDKESIAEWTRAILDEYPSLNIVGEVWMHQTSQIAYWQANSPIGGLQGYNSHLPSVMDFTLHDAVMLAFNETRPSWDKGAIRLYENFVNDYLYPDPNQLLVFAENHDTPRINELFDGNLNLYKMAMTLILTTRGIPQLYYGSEIGMRGQKSVGDADIRRDFPGGWNSDTNNAFNKTGRTKEQEAFHDITRTLLQWRKTSKAVQEGSFLHFLPQNNVYVYFRNLDDEKVMVVLNLSEEDQTLTTARYEEGLEGARGFRNVLTGEEGIFNKTFTIGKQSVLVFECY